MRNIIALNVIISLFLVACSPSANQVNDIYRINREQKLYELSVIWKELSYNFANMDNCSGLDIDSLYQAYISIILNTENDFEYCNAMQRFLANFNNGHVCCQYPDYVYQQLGYLPFVTSYRNNKMFIENISILDTGQIYIDDEIISINNISATDYIQEYLIPYISISNSEFKLDQAMFGINFYSGMLKNESVELKIRRSNEVKKVILYANDFFILSPYKTPMLKKYLTYAGNIFLEDSLNDFAYVRLTECNEKFQEFFLKNYDRISHHKNLIIDISFNIGGNSHNTYPVIEYLVNHDSILGYSEKTRINNAFYKAYAAGGMHFYANEISESFKTKYYPFYFNKAFEKVLRSEGNISHNTVINSSRYNGHIYVITSPNTVSAGEYFTVMLSQDENITFLGKKTAGAMGLPLHIFLPSGLKVSINTTKTYDFQGNDISSGFLPNYEYDFSEFYKTEDPNEMLSKFVKIIQELNKK